ncbi:MAG TPA: alanine racemase [Terracidiphilus sp.]|nr:alanine racemase [Terracidiphilus sp.]
MPTRPCWVEIHTRALEANFRFLAGLAHPHAELLAIVKADAYGHSLALCAPAVEHAGARWLGVTSVEEGAAVRNLCPEARILVLAGPFPGQGRDCILHGLTPVVWETWQLDELALAHPHGAPQLPVHLEIDTGMSRQGSAIDQLQPLLIRFAAPSPFRLEGLMTHLYAADEADGRVTRDQLRRLDLVLTRLAALGLQPDWLNVGNSAALLAGQAALIHALAARYGGRALLRPGLALYGLVPEFDPDFNPGNGPAEPAPLTEARRTVQPVLSWKTRIVSLRSVPAGVAVGYNSSFVASQPMRLALLAAGYGDGLSRSLGNHFSVLVHGRFAPFVGRISMDQSVIDVSDIEEAAPGDEVVLIGTQNSQTITAFDHARAAQTIPWEVFTRIGPRVPRCAV